LNIIHTDIGPLVPSFVAQLTGLALISMYKALVVGRGNATVDTTMKMSGKVHAKLWKENAK
jgi:hypothetical protein